MGCETPACVTSSSEEKNLWLWFHLLKKKKTGPVFSYLTCCVLFFLQDKHPPVRTSGLKPSTLKQLGQAVLQPPSAEEQKVAMVCFSNAQFFPWDYFSQMRGMSWMLRNRIWECSTLMMMEVVTDGFYEMALKQIEYWMVKSRNSDERCWWTVLRPAALKTFWLLPEDIWGSGGGLGIWHVILATEGLRFTCERWLSRKQSLLRCWNASTRILKP